MGFAIKYINNRIRYHKGNLSYYLSLMDEKAPKDFNKECFDKATIEKKKVKELLEMLKAAAESER